MQGMHELIQLSKHLGNHWVPALFGDLPLTRIRGTNFQSTWIFQVLEFFLNLYAQCRRGGKDQTIHIINCGQDIVLISSLFSKWKTR